MTVSSFCTNIILGDIPIIEGADLVSTRCVRTDYLRLGAALIQFRTTKMYALQCGTTMYTCDQREAKRIVFALRLREHVDGSGMTQKAFADALGIPLRSLEEYISGRSTPKPMMQTALLEAARKIVKEK